MEGIQPTFTLNLFYVLLLRMWSFGNWFGLVSLLPRLKSFVGNLCEVGSRQKTNLLEEVLWIGIWQFAPSVFRKGIGKPFIFLMLYFVENLDVCLFVVGVELGDAQRTNGGLVGLATRTTK